MTITRGKPLTGYGTQFVAESYTDADDKTVFAEDADKAYDYFAEAEREHL